MGSTFLVVRVPVNKETHSLKFELKNENDSDLFFQVETTNPVRFSIKPRSEGVLVSQGIEAFTLEVFLGAKYLAPTFVDYFLCFKSRPSNHIFGEAGMHDERQSWTTKRIRIIVYEGAVQSDVSAKMDKVVHQFTLSNNETAHGDIPLEFDEKTHDHVASQESSHYFEYNVAQNRCSFYIDDNGEIDIQRFLAVDYEHHKYVLFEILSDGEAAKALFSKFSTPTSISKLKDILTQLA